jgi:spore germination cell wall hydrolase CwlJ-like protein
MSKKQKFMCVTIPVLVMLVGSTLNPMLRNSYESIAVESKNESSVVSYVELDSRGFEETNDVTPTPIVEKNEVQKKNSNEIKSLSIEEVKSEPVYNWTTTDKVNLRSEASINSDIIMTLEKRAKVKLLETPKKTSSKEWIKVQYGKETGYIYSKYLRDTELPSLDFTDDEIELMAKIVWLEARSEGDEGEAAVAIVIVNRILSSQFPDTLYEVLSEKNAFSSWKLLNSAQPTETEREIATEVINGEWKGLLTDDTVYFSTSPRNNNIVTKIGAHWFCGY